MSLIIVFLIGIVTGILANAIYGYLSTKVSWILDYPDIRKTWLGEYVDINGETVYEEIKVKNQLFNRISGTFITKNKTSFNSKQYEYAFMGKFLDKSYVSVSFKAKDTSFTDYGVAIYKVDTAHRSFEGSSVSLSLDENGRIFSHAFKGKQIDNV
jgi:hypothetical protein